MADNLNKKDYKEGVDSLIDFNEVIEKEKNKSIFEGINLRNERAEDETYQEYKDRLKINNTILKLYRKLGPAQCWELYPGGFKSAIDAVKESQKQQLTATMTTEDGKTIPVTIKQDGDGSNS